MKEELKNAWKHLESIGYEPYYLAVYGSQNYNLDTPESDVDFKCIIIPTLDQLIKNSKPVSTVVEFNGWQIEIKDIRSYVESVVKCNINFLEILNTKYYLCKNPDDEFLRPYFIPLMEEMGQFYLKACYGMMLEKEQALRHPYPSTAHKIEKFGYDPKQLHHIVRLLHLMRRYEDGHIGDFLHEGDQRNELIWIKKWMVKDDPELGVDFVVHASLEEAKNIRDRYTKEPVFTTKYKLIEKSYSIIHEHICKNLRK